MTGKKTKPAGFDSNCPVPITGRSSGGCATRSPRTSSRCDLGKAQAVLALALAAAPVAADAQTTEQPEPRSCQQLHEEMGKCEAGMRSSDQHVIDRLQAPT